MSEQQEVIDSVRKEISLNRSILEVREVLVCFKGKGKGKGKGKSKSKSKSKSMSQSCMYECLQKLRYIEGEELILELMDFVEGFCRPDLGIYS